MSDRDQALAIELVDGRLVISIGIDTLMVAVLAGDDWPEDQFEITDPDAFATAIVSGLEQEQEDGTTDIHLAIDKAALYALEYGCEGVEEIAKSDDGDAE